MPTDLFPGATLQQSVGFFVRASIDPQLAVSVVHITAGLGNAATIAKSVEAKGVTATFWTNRDGSAVQGMGDPLRMAPWTNGFLNRPDLSNARIAAMVRAGVNPNKRCLVTIENVGLEPGNPITPAQEKTCADIIRYYHSKHGVPISRETVVGHYQFDGVNRVNCPSTNKAILDRIVAMAQGGAEVPPPGTKNVGPRIGTFAWTGTDHLLISTSDTINLRFPQSNYPGPFPVVSINDLVDPIAGKPIDIDGNQPPKNNRDQVYVVETPGASCYALRADGTFVPANGSGDAKAGAQAAADAAQKVADTLP